MRRMTFNEKRDEREQREPEHDVTMCKAHGCPHRGSVDLGNAGRFFCSAHAWAEPDRWSSITSELRMVDWLVELMRDLGDHVKMRQWREFATQFWSEDRDHQPGPDESREMYLYRMHLELMARSGARKRGATGPMRRQCETMPMIRGGVAS